jgi:hypothetical protein
VGQRQRLKDTGKRVHIVGLNHSDAALSLKRDPKLPRPS